MSRQRTSRASRLLTREDIAKRIALLPEHLRAHAADLALKVFMTDLEVEKLSLRAFVEQAWPLIDPAPFAANWHIDAICDHLEAAFNRELKRLLIAMPPRAGKSSLISVLFPAWVWTQNPKEQFLCASYAYALAVRDARKCRAVVKSPWYQQRWGALCKINIDQDQKARFDTMAGGHRIATSVGGSTTGEGGTILIVDDPIKADEAMSDLVREGANEWWDQAFSTRLNDPQDGLMFVVMQRLHDRDLIGHLLEQGGWEILRLPARYDQDRHVTSIGWADPRLRPGEVMWESRYPDAVLRGIERTLGSYGIASQLQQRPAPAGGGMFKDWWWRFWYAQGPEPNPVPVQKQIVMPQSGEVRMEWTTHKQMEVPEWFDDVIQSWDMTYKDTVGSDYISGQVWGRRGGNRFLLDRFYEKRDFPGAIEAVREMSARWPQAVTKLIENKANGPAVVSTLHEELPGLIAVEPDGSKVSRANGAAVPAVEAGNVYLPHPDMCPWVVDFMSQHAAFPRGKRDDDVDAHSQAARRFQQTGEETFGWWAGEHLPGNLNMEVW